MDIRKAVELFKANPYHDEQGRFTSADNAASAAAKSLADRAQLDEPSVSKDLRGFESSEMYLAGFDFRFKSVSSLTRKIQDGALMEGISIEQKASEISDSLRYTLVTDNDKYVSKVTNAVNDLKAKGYEVHTLRNFWDIDPNDENVPVYQGINMVFKTPRGTRFELQFHTPESFKAKQEKNHGLYEEFRARGTSLERRTELMRLMEQNQREVPVPTGAWSLLTA